MLTPRSAARSRSASAAASSNSMVLAFDCMPQRLRSGGGVVETAFGGRDPRSSRLEGACSEFAAVLRGLLRSRLRMRAVVVATEPGCPQIPKGPVLRPGLRYFSADKAGLRRLVLDHLFGGFLGGLGTTARALGEGGFDLLHGLGLGATLHRRDLAREPVERGLIELALRIALLRLRVGAEQVAHDFRDGDDVARVDLGFVFLRAARPHGALDASTALERLERALDQPAFGELA